MSRMTSTGQGAERTTWQRSARATPGAWRRTRSPSGRRSWRRRTRPSARRWPTCGRSWASARTYSPSTRPGTGPCRTMAFGAGAGWGGGWPLPRWTLCFLSDRTTPEPTFLTSALYQRHQHSRPARRRVCARTPVLVLPCVVRGVRARASFSLHLLFPDSPLTLF